jgi:transcriptional regulator with XRE-family HTH domain
VKQKSRGRLAASEHGPDQIDIEVGLNLRRARLARGFSQTELGEALGISFQQVQKYERGANRVSASMLVKAARFLEIRASDLLPPDDGVQPAPEVMQRITDVRGLAEIVNAYCAVPDPVLRRALLKLTKALGSKEAAAAEDPAGAAGARPR